MQSRRMGHAEHSMRPLPRMRSSIRSRPSWSVMVFHMRSARSGSIAAIRAQAGIVSRPFMAAVPEQTPAARFGSLFMRPPRFRRVG